MSTLNETPKANRIHIGVFGRTNSGKSSFINAVTNQEVSIVSAEKGTTTDPVYKPMEIYPLGPCVFIDTAGDNDQTPLQDERTKKTKLAAEKSDIAIILVAADKEDDDFSVEKEWHRFFEERKTPVCFVINKADKKEAKPLVNKIKELFQVETLSVSAKTGEGIDLVRPMLARLIPEGYGEESITKDLCEKGDSVVLVMPQDIQAPKGRLILPQVQILRELLDKKCHVTCLTTDEFEAGLSELKKPPKLIITDSQVFDKVYDKKPDESLLTSFSVLLAAHKGDIEYFVKGAKIISSLTEDSKVLIAECCTHAPLEEDIGRVKIPRMLKNKIGQNLTIDIVSGTDFPEELSEYDLIIQCGACMFNKKYVLSRVDKAKDKNVPMTNYGICIAYLKGILDNVAFPG